jgi:hypothetical protein
MNTDKFEYFPADTKDPCEKYVQPKPYTQETKNGYPNAIPNTQTERTRGTKNTSRGFGHSKKMG